MTRSPQTSCRNHGLGALGTTLVLQIVTISRRASQSILAFTAVAALNIFGSERISTTCLYSYWCRTSASAEYIRNMFNKFWRNGIKILPKLNMISIALGGILIILPLSARAVPISLGSSLELAVQADVLMSSFDEASIRTRQAVTTWQSSSRGNLIFNLSWDTVNVTAGIVNLSSDWLYSFIADADGFFQLDYNIAAFSSDLFGINGFSFISLAAEKTALFFPFQPELKDTGIIGNLVPTSHSRPDLHGKN